MKDRPQFRTYAFFYKYASEQACRKYLDIKRNGRQLEHPELIMLMTQPGDCENADEIWEQEIEIPADHTALKIQEFMTRHGLRWVRVLSLSDMQGKWDEAFFKAFAGTGDKVFPAHSIFHSARADELAEYASSGTPFILAGNQDKKTRIVANAAVNHMREKGFKIIYKPGPSQKGPGKKSSWIDEAEAHYKMFVGEDGQLESPTPAAGREKPKKGQGQAEPDMKAAFRQFLLAQPPHLMISSANASGKRSRFSELLRKKKLLPFTGTDKYDYIFSDHVTSTQALADLLSRHNGKRIILDTTANPRLLATRGALRLLESVTGAQPGLKPLERLFSGQLVILTDHTKEELEHQKSFAWLAKNWLVV